MSEEDEPKKAAADAADGEDDDKENLDDSRANSSLANSTFVTSGRIQNEKADVEVDGTLDLANLSLTNLEKSFAAEYSEVKHLKISGNCFQKFTYIKLFPKCQIIDARDCQINKFIADFNYNLLELHLARNQLKETNQLGRFENLKILDLSNNLIEPPVSFSLKNLEILNLSGNFLNEIPDLSKCVALQTISLADNKISDLTTITKLICPTNLKNLDISSNSIEDLSQFSVLSTFKKLEEFVVAGNPSITSVLDSDLFDYRSYIFACCSEQLHTIDGQKIEDQVQTEGEWLALQGSIKKIGPGNHDALCQQIASHFPDSGPPTPAQKSCHKALEKRRSMKVPEKHLEEFSEDTDRTENSVYSPFREWNGKIGALMTPEASGSSRRIPVNNYFQKHSMFSLGVTMQI